MILLLKVEGKRPEQVREFSTVETALRELDASGPHSFATLTRQDGSYVQVAGGKEKCLIEKRDIPHQMHWRAYWRPVSATSDSLQVITCGAGQITARADEIFSVEDVVSIWRSFCYNKPSASEVMWRSMSEIFR
jgi:hypothetical protein